MPKSMRILVLVVLLALPTLSFADIATTPLGGAVTANTMSTVRSSLGPRNSFTGMSFPKLTT